MPRLRKKTTKFTAPHVTSSEIIADFQKIHPFLHSHVALILQRLGILLAFLGVVIGNTSLVGFFLRNQFNIRTLNFFITRPSIALSIFLLSLGILFAMTRKKNIIVALIIYILAGTSLVFSVFGLLSHIQVVRQITYPWFAGFTPEALNRFFQAAPNATLIVISYSLALIFLQRRATIFLSQIFTLLGLLILLPTNIGFIYGSNFIYSASTSTILLPITAIGLTIVGASLLFSRASQGFMRGLTNQTTGGFFARRFVFLAMATPIVLGWLDLGGFYLHWYDVQSRFLLLVTFTILMLLVWTIFMARSLQTLDITRRYIQDNIIFLSEASKILSTSLDYRKNFRRLAELTITQFADLCSIDMKTPDGSVKQLIVAHKTPRKLRWVQSVKKRNALQKLLQSKELLAPLRTGKSQLYSFAENQNVVRTTLPKENTEFLHQVPNTSIIVVPLIVQHQPIGIMQFVSTNPQHIYSTSEVQIAEELASRASLAIENTRLYHNAQEAIRVRDEFMSIASHELKTPLTSLKVYTEVLLHTFVGKDKKTATYLQKMDDQITNLTNLIKDLLDVSRIQVGKLAFHFETVNLEEIAKNVVENFQLTALNHKITLQGTITHTITGDKDRLGQVILNLLTNAVKYSPQANKVAVTLSEDTQSVSVAVQDFGIGIDKKHMNKIFDRFYQVGNKRRINVGLGMGLYISKEIIQRHGGTIAVETTKGKGSVFTFTIPTKQPKLSS